MNDIFKTFFISGLSGSVGAFCVYPIDLVKTRMQNQINYNNRKIIYNNSLDCFRKTFKNDGFFGFFRGARPNVAGVFPEKAIKITINKKMNELLQDKNKKVPFLSQLIAGGMAGAGQVIITNPMEIIKIQLQMQSVMKIQNNNTVLSVIRNIGVRNLYKGSTACFMRDIPFSFIYFPLYKAIKCQNKDCFANHIFSGMVSGAISAYTVTPFDVVKTRLQTKRNDNIVYKGLRDCFKKIYRNEGLTAFYKGSMARATRSSIQFGITFAVFEFLGLL